LDLDCLLYRKITLKDISVEDNTLEVLLELFKILAVAAGSLVEVV